MASARVRVNRWISNFEKNPEVRLLVSDQSIAARVQELLDEKGVNVQYVLERTWMDRDFYVEIYRFEPSR